MKTIDCKGLSCPAPVLKSKEVIENEHPEKLRVIVDNKAAQENVARFLGSQNYGIVMEQDNGGFYITGNLDTSSSVDDPSTDLPKSAQKKIMVMVATDSIGHGDDVLGSKLMVNFLATLKEMGQELWRLVFVNNGVKLTIEGASVLATLKELEEQGTHILVCGTCLDHFKLLDKKRVGETTNMLDIVTSMQIADKMINI